MKKINVLSLFGGIECGRVALERLGIQIENYYSSEIDPYAMEITRKNYPDIKHIGSVKDVEYHYGSLRSKDFEEEAYIDLLIGGSPCQDLSIAKANGKGLSGERSGLFFEYVRILKEVKPKYFLLENVASMKKADRDEITRIMGVEPILINSALVSAQNRKRLYWTNIPGVTQPKKKRIFLEDVLQNSISVGRVNEKIKELKKDDYYKEIPIRLGYFNKAGQGDRVYSIKGKSISLSANGGGRGAKTGLYYVDGYARKLTPVECERLQTLPDNYTIFVSNSQRYKAIGNGWTVDIIAHILSFADLEANNNTHKI